MGYVLNAVLARAGVMKLEPSDLEHTRLIGLPQGFELLPIPLELPEGWDDEHHPLDPPAALERMEAELFSRILSWSASGRVAYLEIDLFGGLGERAAGVWEAGRAVLEPRRGASIQITNEALRLLGVERGEHFDEFEALELGKHRHTERWLERG